VSQLLTRRSLGLLGVALVLMAIMIGLGVWQYQAYDEHQRDDAQQSAASDPMPLDEALGPDDGFSADAVGQPVTASGTYVSDEQIYVTGLAGVSERYAVVTPLLTASGSAVLVVRGGTSERTAPAPDGEIEVEGSLQPSMAEGTGVDEERIAEGIRTSSLVGAFSDDLYSGYIVMTSSDPADDLTPVPPPLPDASRWAVIRNLIYALQWWLFAAFVAFMWWRIAHEDRDQAREDVG
jgi:cytochrome oxidase assembly protein ShyY1